MSEPYDVTTAADRACGLRRYCDRTGREWTEPRPGLKRATIDESGFTLDTPDGFRPITIRAYTDGRQVVIPEQEGLPLPCETVEDDHNCDLNGCGWEHVMARFLLPREPQPAPGDDTSTEATT